jgi:hypothetical protein
MFAAMEIDILTEAWIIFTPDNNDDDTDRAFLATIA